MEAVIIIGHNINLQNYDFTNKYVIGVDKGCLYAINNNVQLDLAVGDFDSISPIELEQIKNKTKVLKLNPIKDDTDTNKAISLCSNASKITILGGIQGKRIEHFLANIMLLKNDSRIEIIDDYSHIFVIDKNIELTVSEYKYVSLFSLQNTYNLTLTGFKYNLDNYNLSIDDPLCISNEIIEPTALIRFKEGKILVILSKQDH